VGTIIALAALAALVLDNDLMPIVATLCVGMRFVTLCVTFNGRRGAWERSSRLPRLPAITI
jgi:hypothetical protein